MRSPHILPHILPHATRRLAAALVLAVLGAATGPALAAPWIMRHGLTEAQYQAFFDNDLPAGYRPISVSAHGTGAARRFTVVAIHDPGVSWVARHDLTAAGYQAETDLWDAQGYRVDAVDAYGQYPDERYVATWVADGTPDPDWAARHRMTDATFQQEFDDLADAGLRLTWIAGYGTGANRRFAAVWVRNNEQWSWIGKWGLNEQEYQDYVNARLGEGYRVHALTSYDDPGDPLYGAIFIRPDGPNWQIQPQWLARHAQSGDAFQQTADDLDGTSFQPTCAIQYGSNANPRFGSAWFEDLPAPSFSVTGTAVPELAGFDQVMEDFMVSRKISRGSLAVTKDGRLVLARAYTNAHPTFGLTRPDDRFRVASVSKPLTAVAILQLVEQGLIGDANETFAERLDTPLGDIPGFPGNGWTDDWFDLVTVRHLLQHRGGWDSGASFDPMFRDFTISDDLGVPLPISIQNIITYMKGKFFDFYPGTDYAYSNFGYALLGRVIEAASGQSYEDYVRDNVLCPVGAQTMVLGRSEREHRYADEVGYRDPMNAWGTTRFGGGGLVPRGYGTFNIENMAAHGAWVATPTELARFVGDFTTVTGSALLDPASIGFMWTPTAESGGGYGAGWTISGSTSYHNGSLPGTWAYIIRRSDGVTISVVLNQRSKDWETPVKDLDWQIRSNLQDAADMVSLWPAHDFFDPSTCADRAWDDDFDRYEVGRLADQSDWEPWNGERIASDFMVTDAAARSGPHSVAIDGADDAVHRYDIRSGVWRYTAWVLVPAAMDDLQHFILLNTYPTEGLESWSLQLQIDGAAGLFADRNSAAQLPLVRGRWAEIRVDIDLEADEQTAYYDGQLLLTKSWSAGVAEGGSTTIQAVDLYGTDSRHEIFYDDLSLEPIEDSCPADLDGSGAVDFGDVLAILGAWGNPGGPEDLDGSGLVDFGDMVVVLASWGPCP